MAKVPTDASVTSGPGSACRSLDDHGIFWGHVFPPTELELPWPTLFQKNMFRFLTLSYQRVW